MPYTMLWLCAVCGARGNGYEEMLEHQFVPPHRTYRQGIRIHVHCAFHCVYRCEQCHVYFFTVRGVERHVRRCPNLWQ